jgi:hypothetical protein
MRCPAWRMPARHRRTRLQKPALNNAQTRPSAHWGKCLGGCMGPEARRTAWHATATEHTQPYQHRGPGQRRRPRSKLRDQVRQTTRLLGHRADNKRKPGQCAQSRLRAARKKVTQKGVYAHPTTWRATECQALRARSCARSHMHCPHEHMHMHPPPTHTHTRARGRAAHLRHEAVAAANKKPKGIHLCTGAERKASHRSTRAGCART